jgi:hypothetical protein
MAHTAMRRRLAPLVAGGTVRCARCTELIGPGEKWELDPRDDGRGWLGPSHQRCNSRAGWEKMVGRNGNCAGLEERPYRWSQRWFADPPIGATVNAGDSLVEVHVGNGVWHTVARSELLPDEDREW